MRKTAPPGTSRSRVYEALGLTPLDFQEESLTAYRAGRSGMIQVPTGSGKTLAAIAGPLERMAAAGDGSGRHPALRVLYLTPLRALSRDTEAAIRRVIQTLELPVSVEVRTGDVSASRKARQLEAMPDILITTPESLSVLLARPGASELFSELETVIVDEWHELLSTKRGTQTELALTHLRALRPELRTWALSATVGNPREALQAACGSPADARPTAVILTSAIRRDIDIDILYPESSKGLPWAGHLGLSMAPALVSALDPHESTLIFTNTRKQAEAWYQKLLELAPEQASRTALHHGSIDREIRSRIEENAKAGRLRWTVATSSLDLGIDFTPVERVVQIGSPKSIARVIQRAGRSAHQPGRRSRMLFVPTHALELLEAEAAREALEDPQIEARRPVEAPLDVLAQHMVTLACGDGFREEELYAEVRSSAAYAGLTRERFDWVLDFVARGGHSLDGYEHYRKLEKRDGRWHVRTKPIARLHRMSIGTIEGNSQVRVMFTNQKPVGQVEEGFISQLRKGDRFFFAGRMLEFVMMKDMTVYVRSATGRAGLTPSWPGGSLPLSPSLAAALRRYLAAAASTQGYSHPASRAIIEAQAAHSLVPDDGELLLELLHRRRSAHLFVYPFAGRAVHEGLAALLSLRLQARRPASFGITTNDYGLQIETDRDYPFDELLREPDLLSAEGVHPALLHGHNMRELARRRFRGIARVSGLVFPGYPGARKSTRQLQTSAELLFDVFETHEPDNLLLQEAHREVLRENLDEERLTAALRRLSGLTRRLVPLEKPSPFAFPLLAEQLTQRSSNLSFQERVERLRRSYGLA